MYFFPQAIREPIWWRSRSVFRARRNTRPVFADDQNPVRIEFWGDTVDTMAHFDIMSQRRTDNVDKLTLMPSTEIVFSGGDDLMKKITAFYDTVKGKGAKKGSRNAAKGYRQAQKRRELKLCR